MQSHSDWEPLEPNEHIDSMLNINHTVTAKTIFKEEFELEKLSESELRYLNQKLMCIRERYTCVINNISLKITNLWEERLRDIHIELERERQEEKEKARIKEIEKIGIKNYSKKLRADISKRHNKLFIEIGRRDGFACQRCGEAKPDMVIDHIIPVSKGGTNDLENLQLLCTPCNLKKSDKIEE